MSIALVEVEKTFGSHTWSNTYGVVIGAGTGIPGNTDLDAIGAAAQITAANTSGTGALTFLQRLVYFERQMYDANVFVTGVYVTDGKKAKVNPAATVYATQAFSVAGQRAVTGAPNTILPGNVTLLIHRNIAGYGHKPGRLFLRACLSETDVKVGGPKMIDWTDQTVAASYGTTLGFAISNSLLNRHLQGGADATVAVLALPIYATTRTASLLGQPVGSLVDAIPVNGMSVAYPVGRQVQRGRKRKAGV